MDELPHVPIVVLASACWDTPARVNCHEIAERFARRGHPVLFVESTGLRSPALRNSAHDRRRVLQRSLSWLRGASLGWQLVQVDSEWHTEQRPVIPSSRARKAWPWKRSQACAWLAGAQARSITEWHTEQESSTPSAS